ncbi:MAG: TolC family protein, partial [Planctomycetota bacterium]
EAKLKANQAAISLADELIRNIKARVERGAGNQFDLNLVELDRLRFQSDALRTETEVAAARRSLLDIIGLPPTTTLKLQVDRNRPTPLVRDWNLDGLIAVLLESPRLKILQWRYEAAEGELLAAIARQFPSLKLGPTTDFAYNGNAWESFVGSLVTFQVPFLNRNGAQIKEKTIARDIARANYYAELHTVRAELADAIGIMRSLEKRVIFNRDEMLPKVNESIALSEKAFAAGEISVISLLKAQSSVIEAKINYYDILIEHRRTLQRIEAALGRRLEDVPDASQQPKQEVSTDNVNPIQER